MEELANSARKRALRVSPGAGIKNEAEKERSRAAKQLDTHMKVTMHPTQLLHTQKSLYSSPFLTLQGLQCQQHQHQH